MIVFIKGPQFLSSTPRLLKKNREKLPPKFLCRNSEYIKGLYDGLIDSDGCKETPSDAGPRVSLSNTSINVIQLFEWCCLMQRQSFNVNKTKKSIGNLKGTKLENLQQGYQAKTVRGNRYDDDKGWNYCTISSMVP